MISPSGDTAGTQGLSGRSGAISSADVAQPASHREDKMHATAFSRCRMLTLSLIVAARKLCCDTLKPSEMRFGESLDHAGTAGRGGALGRAWRTDLCRDCLQSRARGEAFRQPIKPWRNAG